MYIAPEIIKRIGYGPPIDIWAVGIIMYKLFKKNHHPFLDSELSKKELLK